MHNLFIHGDNDLHRLLNREVDSIPVAYISTKYDVKKYPDLKGLFDQRSQFLYHSQEDAGVYLAFCFSRIGTAQSKHGLPVADVMSKTLKEVVSEDFSDDSTPIFSTITYKELVTYIIKNAQEHLLCERHIDIRPFDINFFGISEDVFLMTVNIPKEEIKSALSGGIPDSPSGDLDVISWVTEYNFHL